MSNAKQKAIAKPTTSANTNGNRTPESLRHTLREHPVHETAKDQLLALGAIYDVATHENEVNIDRLLRVIGKVQNVYSLAIRVAALNKKRYEGQFFLNA